MISRPRFSLVVAAILGLLFALVHADKVDVIEVDVLIAGYGPGGASAANQLQSAIPGLRVVAFDPSPVIGGNCNSVRIPSSEVPPGYPDVEEAGTSDFEDSVVMNTVGQYPPFNFKDPLYVIDSFAYANSIVPGIAVHIPVGAAEQSTYYYNFAMGNATSPTPYFQFGYQAPNPAAAQAFFAAFNNYAALLAQYPYANNCSWANAGDQLPAELIQPFYITMQQRGLMALDPLFQQLCVGELNFRMLPTMYVIAELPLSLVGIVEIPNAGFFLAGGCSRLYNAMADILGRQNIFLNTTLESKMIRLEGDHQPNRIIARLKTVNADGSITRRIVFARKLIIAHALTLENSAMYDLDAMETDALSGLVAPHLYALQVDIQGPITQDPNNMSLPVGYQVVNYNLGQPLPDPRVEYFQRGLPYGPSVSIVISSTILDLQAVSNVVDAAMQQLMIAGAVTNYQILYENNHLYFGPQFSAEKLAGKNPYLKIEAIEGHRNTHHLGSHKYGSPGTVFVWDLAKRLTMRLVASGFTAGGN